MDYYVNKLVSLGNNLYANKKLLERVPDSLKPPRVAVFYAL